MILFPILNFASTSYRISNLCWSKTVPPPQTCHLPPPPPPPKDQRSVMGVVITFLRLPVISYQVYMNLSKSVRPPRLLLLILVQLLAALILLLGVLLVLLVLLSVVTTGIMLLLLILLPPGTLTTIVLPIRNLAMQFLAQVTKSCLPSPIQNLFSAMLSLHRGWLNRGGSVVVQKAPNVAPVPSVVVTPTCLPIVSPLPSTSPRPRTLRRSKSWFRW